MQKISWNPTSTKLKINKVPERDRFSVLGLIYFSSFTFILKVFSISDVGGDVVTWAVKYKSLLKKIQFAFTRRGIWTGQRLDLRGTGTLNQFVCIVLKRSINKEMGSSRSKCKSESHCGSCGSSNSMPEHNGIPTYLTSNALVPSNSNSIQTSMVIPRNGTVTRHHNQMEEGIQTYQRIVIKIGKPAETDEFRIYSYD